MYSDNTQNNGEFFLSGQIANPRRFLFNRNIPIVVHASDSELTFSIRHGKVSKKFISYDRLDAAVISNFFGRRKLLLHANSGVEVIKCFDSGYRVSAFCEFVNENIRLSKDRPLTPKYQLTQLQASSAQRVQQIEHLSEEKDSALDLIFNPDKLENEFFDNIDKNININYEGSIVNNNTLSAPIKIIQKDKHSDRYELFRNKKERVWNLNLNRGHIRKFLLGASVIVLGLVTAFQLSELPDPQPGGVATATKDPVIRPQPNSPPEHQTRDTPPRVLAQLVSIVQDDQSYHLLIHTLIQKRTKRGLGAQELRDRLGWNEARLMSIESKSVRASPIEIIDYVLAINADMHEIIESIK